MVDSPGNYCHACRSKRDIYQYARGGRDDLPFDFIVAGDEDNRIANILETHSQYIIGILGALCRAYHFILADPLAKPVERIPQCFFDDEQISFWQDSTL